MSVLSDLEAALGAYEAEREWLSARSHGNSQRYICAWNDLTALLVPAAPALVAVARAAREIGIYIDEDYYNADEERVFGRLAAALAPLVKEADCPTCHGHGGGGGFDRNGSHAEDRYCEYPCPTCGKEADDE